jgi:hypothetical protein
MKSGKPSEEMTPEDVRRRWPRVTAHVIAESLGYATPDVAASIIRDALLGRENHCEWVATCYGGNARRVLSNSIQDRRYHKGYMAEYRLALQIVRRANQTGDGPVLASWF